MGLHMTDSYNTANECPECYITSEKVREGSSCSPVNIKVRLTSIGNLLID